MAQVTVTRDVLFQVRRAVTLTRVVTWHMEEAVDKTAPTTVPVPGSGPYEYAQPFRRVRVSFLTLGASRVTWEFFPEFADAGPYTYTLQASHAGTPGAADWVDVGPTVVDAAYLLDDRQRVYGQTLTTRYRIILVTADGSYASPIGVPLGDLNEHDWVIAREVLRKEQLRHRVFTSIDGYLLKRKWYGTACPNNDPLTGHVTTSFCLTCFGTGIVGGYHQAVPFTFGDLTPEGSFERREGGRGTVNDVTVIGRFLGDMPLAANDLWVSRASDERYYVRETQELAHYRGVPLVVQAKLGRAPRSEIAYHVPVG